MESALPTISSQKHGSPLQVVMLAFDFPPFVGGGGSMRMRKLAKYLARDEDIHLRVLTGGWESRDADAAALAGLEQIPLHVAASVPVRPDPGNRTPAKMLHVLGVVLRSLLQMPDNRFRFLPRLVSELRRLHREVPVDVVLITSPPNSMSLMPPLVKALGPDSRVVLDVRDLWALDPLMRPDNALFRAVQRRMERWALSHADAIVTVTPGYQRWLQGQLRGSVPVHLLTNGYDEEDWRGLQPQRVHPRRVLISHAGSLGGINGPRSLRPLALALEILHQQHPALAERLAFQFLGTVPPEEQRELRKRAPGVEFTFTGFLSHRESLARLAASDALCLLHFDLAHCELIYPGKLFEYYRLGLPLVAFTPPGLLEDFVRERDLGECAAYGDAQAICQAIIRLVKRLDAGPAYGGRREDVVEFERGALSARYAALLKEVATSQAKGSPRRN